MTARPYRVEVARGTDPNRQIRSLVIDVHLVGSRRICLLRLGALSTQPDREGSRRIVWMIKRMIKRLGQLLAAR